MLGCGSGGDVSVDLAPETVQEITAKLDQIQERFDSGDCTGPNSADSSLASLRAAVEALDGGEQFTSDMNRMLDNLGQQIATQCREAETTTTEPDTTTDTTPPPLTDTTTTTTTKDTTTETTTTKTTTTTTPEPPTGPTGNGNGNEPGGGVVPRSKKENPGKAKNPKAGKAKDGRPKERSR
jgi:hypothetical protein